MRVQALGIADVKVLVPVRHGDRRGFFSEVYNRRTLEAAGVAVDFVQDNHSLSAERGTVRGLHFQVPPFAQTKLVRVVRGSVFDVAVDVRRGSPTFGRHVSVILSAAEGNQVLVPAGFAHGLMTLEADTEVLYKVSDYYAPDHDRGILWNDPVLGIDWPIAPAEAVLSEKDRTQPCLTEFDTPFEYRSARPISGEGRQRT
ncbi:MAG: dTDP-4-dehydrorhamnose 3,5-epimerase [Gammaproteobacteria bacterium]|nr:dTDP-4-dehydrorhamnose 3,5-epimerase [Gammaproteobacteria bacterium]